MLLNNRYLVIGGPGTGKTTLINHLGLIGYSIKKEAARRVIEWNLDNGGKILPWIDRDLFDKHLFDIMKKDYESANHNEPCFFDGGLIDILAWRKYLGLSNKKFENIKNDFRYEKIVFAPEPWEEIFFKNNARPFSYKESKEITASIINFYEQLGYKIMYIPKISPMQRALMVQELIQKKKSDRE